MKCKIRKIIMISEIVELEMKIDTQKVMQV